MPPWVRHNGRRLAGPWTTVDGTTPDVKPYPVEAGRFVYVMPFGGFSADLDGGEVGLHRQALLENTELEEGDEVTLRVFPAGHPSNFFFRAVYTVVGLDFSTPDAWHQGLHGEAVLSTAVPMDRDNHRLHSAPEAPASVADAPQLQVMINGVLARRLGRTTG